MKRLNKEGPPVLGALPIPPQMVASELDALVQRRDAAIVDTRVDREAVLLGHLPRSLSAPFDKTFPTVVGSYVRPEQPVYLVIHEHHLEAAVRGLIRIGYDKVAGFITPETLERYERKGGELHSTPTIEFAELERRREAGGIRILDVRSAAEYRSGHVPGAQNIAHTRLLDRIGEVPRGEHIGVHCGSGARAAVAVALLEREGFEVTHVNDAFVNWRAAATVGDSSDAAAVR
jgi:hydroxyacylglutathione hydrolase